VPNCIAEPERPTLGMVVLLPVVEGSLRGEEEHLVARGALEHDRLRGCRAENLVAIDLDVKRDAVARRRVDRCPTSHHLRYSERVETDVVLLDIRMPKVDGLGVFHALSAKATAPPCIVLTTFDDDDLVLRAIANGARSFLLKDVSLEQLTSAIRTVADGGSVINPAVTERVLRGIERLGAGFDSLPVPEPLTTREIEIVGMLAAGYSNREIAKACFVAKGTVKNHISNILSKLGVRDRTRAVLRALHLGLI
jgi:DNA-binding NarL/FixJ family response regulator